MARDVAGAARVAVLEPRAADVEVLLVDGEADAGQLARRFERDVQAGAAGADDEHAEPARGVEGLLSDLVRRVEGAIPFVFVGLVRGSGGDFGTQRQGWDMVYAAGVVVVWRGVVLVYRCVGRHCRVWEAWSELQSGKVELGR